MQAIFTQGIKPMLGQKTKFERLVFVKAPVRRLPMWNRLSERHRPKADAFR